MAHPVVTFPQPPPTSNTLTSNQRQQLLRSTRKLTKLLGSTPYLVDYDSSFPAVYLDLSNKLVSRTRSPSRSSYDIPRPLSPASSTSSASTTASRIHHKTHFHSRSEDSVSQDALDSFFSKKRPPMLRLASPDDEFSQSVWAKTKLDTIPGSPPVVKDTDSPQSSPASDVLDGDSADLDHLLAPMSPPLSPITSSLSRPYTLSVPRRRSIPSLFIDTSEPVFKVTSEAATRRLKMERIRKRLGECVPVEAVFPRGYRDEEEVRVLTEKKPVQVNVDVRPRWKASSVAVTFDVIYECPDEHGDEGLSNGLSLTPRAPKSLGRSDTASSRQWGRLIKKTRRDSRV